MCVDALNCTIIRLTTSVWPSVCGWKVVDLVSLMFSVGDGSHSWIAAGAEPDAHQFYVTVVFNG
jgi:hypothetical protein